MAGESVISKGISPLLGGCNRPHLIVSAFGRALARLDSS
jgi:hypothetical protein